MGTLNQLNDILNEEGFFCLGHGTGSDNLDTVYSIFNKGLRTKNNSLYFTTIGLDTKDIDSLKERLDNWPHLNSKKIILIRIPIDYINEIGNCEDLDGERFGAFYNEVIDESGKTVYYLNPKFIVGCYESDRGQVLLNESFEKKLSEETLSTLKQKFLITLEKTKKKISKRRRIF